MFTTSGLVQGLVAPLRCTAMAGCAAVVALLPALLWGAAADLRDDLRKQASWQPPTVEEVESRVRQFLEEAPLDAAARERGEAAWQQAAEAGSSSQLLDRTASVLAAVDPRAAEVVDLCRSASAPLVPPVFTWLHEEQEPAFLRHQLRLLLGRWMAQHRFYDEAQRELADLELEAVVDPATLLFYRAVVHHRLLEKDAGLAAIGQLLENESAVPRRYVTVARLMEADLKPLREDSLDEVARLMEDIQRRLQFGRAGTRVREEEDQVIAKLDKMIENIEQQQQQQQQQQQGASGQGGRQSSRPAEESANLGGSGPGDVDQKSIGNRSGWGNLPPKEREEALQQISKDLPDHFREVIEEYFRKLAREEP